MATDALTPSTKEEWFARKRPDEKPRDVLADAQAAQRFVARGMRPIVNLRRELRRSDVRGAIVASNVQRSRPRQRERRPQSRRVARTAGSRDGPSEPEPPLRRRPDLTSLQQAQWLSAAAFEVARESGLRVFDAFLSIEACKVARETARRWEAEAA
jgi:hypothetical protein